METSATIGVAEVITIGYFMYTSIKAFVAENIGVDTGFKLYLKEEQRQIFMRNWQCKVAETGNVKRFKTT